MRNPIWDGARGSPDPERIHGPVLRDQSIHGQCWLGDEIRTRTHGGKWGPEQQSLTVVTGGEN